MGAKRSAAAGKFGKPDPGALDRFLWGEANHESGNEYEKQHVDTPNNHSSASGAYQFTDETWRHYNKVIGGDQYDRAYEAPPAVQDNAARRMATELWEKYGSWADVAGAWWQGKAPVGDDLYKTPGVKDGYRFPTEPPPGSPPLAAYFWPYLEKYIDYRTQEFPIQSHIPFYSVQDISAAGKMVPSPGTKAFDAFMKTAFPDINWPAHIPLLPQTIEEYEKDVLNRMGRAPANPLGRDAAEHDSGGAKGTSANGPTMWSFDVHPRNSDDQGAPMPASAAGGGTWVWNEAGTRAEFRGDASSWGAVPGSHTYWVPYDGGGGRVEIITPPIGPPVAPPDSKDSPDPNHLVVPSSFTGQSGGQSAENILFVDLPNADAPLAQVAAVALPDADAPVADEVVVELPDADAPADPEVVVDVPNTAAPTADPDGSPAAPDSPSASPAQEPNYTRSDGGEAHVEAGQPAGASTTPNPVGGAEHQPNFTTETGETVHTGGSAPINMSTVDNSLGSPNTGSTSLPHPDVPADADNGINAQVPETAASPPGSEINVSGHVDAETPASAAPATGGQVDEHASNAQAAASNASQSASVYHVSHAVDTSSTDGTGAD